MVIARPSRITPGNEENSEWYAALRTPLCERLGNSGLAIPCITVEPDDTGPSKRLLENRIRRPFQNCNAGVLVGLGPVEDFTRVDHGDWFCHLLETSKCITASTYKGICVSY